MNKSESIKELAPALHKAQGKIKAALKDSTNPHFKSKYADLSSVIEAVKQPLQECGLTYLQGIHDAEGGVSVETMILHISGEWISSTMRIPAVKQDAQGYGSAITYGRRYGLQSMCGVSAEDDDGNAATASQVKASAKSVPQDVWGQMSTDEQTWLQDIADNVRMVGQNKGWDKAVETLAEQGLSTDHKVAIWSRFDSKERAAMEPNKRKAA